MGWGPSSNTWPRCESQREQRTSVRFMPWLVSVMSVTAPSRSGSQKLGQPLPESYLVVEENSAWPHATQR